MAIKPRYDEKSPLDRAIEGYSQKAEQYYKDLNSSEHSLPDSRKKRKKALEDAKKFLGHERRFTEIMSTIQPDLDRYSALGRDATPGSGSEIADNQRLQATVEHHPTDTLERFMRAAPIPKPSSVHTAHHIAPGKGKTKSANLARINIHSFGIRVNDPDNGVWLPRFKEHTPLPKSKGHLQYHTEGCEDWVLRKISTKLNELFIIIDKNNSTLKQHMDAKL